MDVQPNVQTDTVIKAFLRSELQLIRSQKKLLFIKKLLLSAMFFGVFSMQQVHAANVMEGIFKGMVASTDPASVRTASRVGAVGGSFSYRQPQVNTNLVNSFRWGGYRRHGGIVING